MAAIAKGTEKDAAMGLRPRTRLGISSLIKPPQIDFSREQLEEIRLNKVGTFGVGSAGYWRGRAGAALLRLPHYLTPRQLALWLMLYADVGWATA